MWYQFTVPESGPLTVDTLDTDYDTILATFTGACDALVPVPDGLIASGDRAPCRRDDSNGDGILDATDIDAAVAEVFS